MNIAYKLTGTKRLFLASIALKGASTAYSYAWDIYMDWGLLRNSDGLRKTITYPKAFYYFASFIDLVLRLTWLLPLFASKHKWSSTFELTTALLILELVRRWIWALIRIENEQVSNLEKYRLILEVPELGSEAATEAEA
jgi:hypothetical protein